MKKRIKALLKRFSFRKRFNKISATKKVCDKNHSNLRARATRVTLAFTCICFLGVKAAYSIDIPPISIASLRDLNGSCELVKQVQLFKKPRARNFLAILGDKLDMSHIPNFNLYTSLFGFWFLANDPTQSVHIEDRIGLAANPSSTFFLMMDMLLRVILASYEGRFTPKP